MRALRSGGVGDLLGAQYARQLRADAQQAANAVAAAHRIQQRLHSAALLGKLDDELRTLLEPIGMCQADAVGGEVAELDLHGLAEHTAGAGHDHDLSIAPRARRAALIDELAGRSI